MVKEIVRLTEELKKLPGIGGKNAQRLALSMACKDQASLIEALNDIKNIKECEQCNNLTTNTLCDICSDDSRNKKVICTVSSVEDLLKIEELEIFKGLYFVTKQDINPSKGIGPKQLQLEKLEKMLNKETELILANNFTIEGELTAKYIESLFADKVSSVSRLSNGISFGSAINYVDQRSLSNAFLGRRKIK